MRYNLIVISEALTSLAIHLVRRAYEFDPENVHEALILLEEKKLIERGSREELSRLIRLRRLM